MSNAVAPNLVGEPLIQVIGESVTEPRTTPELFTPPPSQNSGHHFQAIWCESWNLRGNNVRIRKDLSVCFSVDTVITSQDIIVGLDKAGIDIDSITAIQRRASNNSWVVTFDCKAVKDAAMNEHSIDIAGCSVLIGDCENRVSIVKIYELPDELPDSVVIGRLSHYGRVISFRSDHVADTILNGVRTARMFIDRPIPSQTFIAGEFARLWYPSQPKTCWKCGSEDHLAAVCKSQRCYNCERPGHRAEQCDMPALCRVCLSDAHDISACPFVYYSSNVTAAKPDRPIQKSYSAAAKSGKFAENARKAEEETSRAKREERAREKERDRKERERDRKEKEEKEEKDRKEKERRDRKDKKRKENDREDRRERRKHDKYHERRHKDGDDHRRGERSDRERDRDRFRPSCDRSSHRHYDYSERESGSESEGWTQVSHRKRKSKSY